MAAAAGRPAVTTIGRDAQSQPIYRYVDDLALPDHQRRTVTAADRPDQGRAADAAYLAALAEARSLIARIESGLDAQPVRGVHWGHVGSLNEVTRHLKLAAHYAGVGDDAWADL